MPEIIKLKDGFAARFRVKTSTGKQERIYLEGFRTKSEAEKAAKEYIENYNENDTISPDATVGEYLDKWFFYYKDQVGSRTAKKYAECVSLHITPYLGKIQLRKLKQSHIIDFYNSLKKKLSAQSIKHIHSCLRLALKCAVDWNYIDSNPATKVKPPKVQNKGKEIFTETQLNQFLKAVQEHPSYIAYYIAATTGIRVGELCALKMEDVDISKKCFYVTNGYDREDPTASTKTPSSRRTVTMLPGTDVVIKNYISKKSVISMEYFCTWENGQPFRPEYLSQNFKKVIRRLGLPEELTLHSLRHTHASMLLKQGVHPKIVQERLGHSSIRVTMDIYSQFIPTMQEDALKNILVFDQNPDQKDRGLREN